MTNFFAIVIALNSLLLQVQHGHTSNQLRHYVYDVASTTVATINTTPTEHAEFVKVKGKYQIVIHEIVPATQSVPMPDPVCNLAKEGTCTY